MAAQGDVQLNVADPSEKTQEAPPQ